MSKITDNITIGLIGGFSMGIGLDLASHLRDSQLLKSPKRYGWFELKDDAMQVLKLASNEIEEYGYLTEDDFKEIVRRYPNNKHESFGFEYVRPSQRLWRTTSHFKIIRDARTGRYMIKAPRPRFE